MGFALHKLKNIWILHCLRITPASKEISNLWHLCWWNQIFTSIISFFHIPSGRNFVCLFCKYNTFRCMKMLSFWSQKKKCSHQKRFQHLCIPLCINSQVITIKVSYDSSFTVAGRMCKYLSEFTKSQQKVSGSKFRHLHLCILWLLFAPLSIFFFCIHSLYQISLRYRKWEC